MMRMVEGTFMKPPNHPKKKPGTPQQESLSAQEVL